MSLPYSYQLPSDRIAQRPCQPAHAAKLLVVDLNSDQLIEDSFFNIPSYLKPNDLLIFNDSRVIPARLFGKRGSLEVELLLLKEQGVARWEAIGRPLRKLKEGDVIVFSQELNAIFLGRTENEGALVEFYFNSQLAAKDKILEAGLMPIPPYIRGGRSDRQDLIDYQTLFAKVEGSIAAPTASLHFSEELIANIQRLGCQISFLTLHVGLSSIKEIESDKKPGSERFSVPAALLETITKTKKAGGRVVAVGTTVVRALESAALARIFDEESGTDLFITPGFDFKIVDAMVTNFHMPASTHLLLVEAFLKDVNLLAKTYSYALEQNFRFLSYGDGMFLVKQ